MPFTKQDIAQLRFLITKLTDFVHIFKRRYSLGLHYQNIAIIGIVCLYYIFWSRNTILIPAVILISITLITALLVTFFFRRFYKKLGLIWSFFHNLTIGFIVVFLFIKSNDFLSDAPVKTADYFIKKIELGTVSKGRMGKEFAPVITVSIEGTDRKLKLHPYYFKYAQEARYVKLSIKEGFWKYPVIKGYFLVNIDNLK